MAPYFALFSVVWIYLRHYINLKILYSEFNEFKTVGPYELDWETEQYKCNISHYISTALLASLQALNMFWLYYIFKIAFRIVFYNVVEDDRSDNDEDELAEEQMDALAHQGSEKAANPKMLLNGSPMNGNATGTEIETNAATNRSVNAKKGRS